MSRQEAIPEEYMPYWKPFTSGMLLYHHTTKANLESIEESGLQPHDPAPKHWAGMKAIFMSDPEDPLYPETLKHVIDHVQEKGEELVRLHIRTGNPLYKSIDPKRTFQVISLDPIIPSEITTFELISWLDEKPDKA